MMNLDDLSSISVYRRSSAAIRLLAFFSTLFSLCWPWWQSAGWGKSGNPHFPEEQV